MHRYDLVKEQMMKPEESIRPVFQEIRNALRGGNRVFFVGQFESVPAGQMPPKLEPAPHPVSGWVDGTYYIGWSKQVTYFVEMTATNIQPVSVPVDRKVNVLEDLAVADIRGWRGQ